MAVTHESRFQKDGCNLIQPILLIENHGICTTDFLQLNEGTDDLVLNDTFSWKSIFDRIKANDWKLFQIALSDFSVELLGAEKIDRLVLHRSRSVLF